MKPVSFDITQIANGFLLRASKGPWQQLPGTDPASALYFATPGEIGEFVAETLRQEGARDAAHEAARVTLSQ